MTNKDLCTKAVAAYHMANPNITVDEWECDPDQEGVAILSIAGRKVYIRHDEANGFEMLKHYDAPAAQQEAEKPQPAVAAVDMPVPEFIPWSDLDEGGTGHLPTVLDLIGIIALVVSALAMLVMPIAIIAGIAAFISLHAVAAIIRSTRSTQAHAAYIEALLVHIAKKEQ